MGMKDSISHLLGGYPAMQQAAIAVLSRIGKPAVPALLDQLATAKDPGTRGRIGLAIEGILSRAENRDRKFLIRLEKLVESGQYSLASSALGCIVKYQGDPEARSIVTRIASKNPNFAIRARALGALVVITGRDKSEIPFFKKFLEDPSLDVRIAAARILGSLGDRTGAPLVLSVLQMPEVDTNAILLQRQAAEAASEIGDPKFIPALKAIQENPARAHARPSAYEAIATIELKNIESESLKIAFLTQKLNERSRTYWAALHLKLIGTAEAASVLSKVAETPNHPGQEDASRFLEIMRREKAVEAQ